MKTKIKKLTQKGFSHFELALVIVIVAAISAVGFYVFNAKNNKSKADSMTSVTNKLIHGSYVSIGSCWKDGVHVSGVSNTDVTNTTYLFTDLRLTDEKFFNKDKDPNLYANNDINTGVYSGRAKPESYKVIVIDLKNGKKVSTNDWWSNNYKPGADHTRVSKVSLQPISIPATSNGTYGTFRYWILFHNQLVYSKDVSLSQIRNCNEPQG